MVSCCQKASLCQERVLKVQTQLKKFLHARFSVADSQEKAVIEWCSNRKNSGWCCQRETQNKEIPGLSHSCGLFLPGCLCVSLLWLWHVKPSQGWSLAVPGSSWAGQEPQGGGVAPALGRDLPAPLSSAAQGPWNNLAFPLLQQKLELLFGKTFLSMDTNLGSSSLWFAYLPSSGIQGLQDSPVPKKSWQLFSLLLIVRYFCHRLDQFWVYWSLFFC